jgi:dTDP-4-dehydrorhamnose 3,5-epimerase-like enzyme
MKVIETSLPGALILEPRVFGDARGFFYESYNKARWADAGIDVDFVQSNVSRSARGVLRGLHYQWPNPQAKLVSVLEGEVYDVAVDIRRGGLRLRHLHLSVHRAVRPAGRRRHPLERRRAGHRLAGQRTLAVGQGWQDTAACGRTA